MNRKHISIIKKNHFSKLSASWCDQLNEGVNKKPSCDKKLQGGNVNLLCQSVICFAFVFIISPFER